MIAEFLHIFGGGLVCRLGDLLDVVEQRPFGRAQTRSLQIALGYRLYRCLFRSLNTQEVSMRVQSIWTAVQVRHPARDGFLGLSRQVPLGEVNRIAELQYVSQKIRPVAEAL